MKYSYDSPYCHDDTSHQRISSKHFFRFLFYPQVTFINPVKICAIPSKFLGYGEVPVHVEEIVFAIANRLWIE